MPLYKKVRFGFVFNATMQQVRKNAVHHSSQKINSFIGGFVPMEFKNFQSTPESFQCTACCQSTGQASLGTFGCVTPLKLLLKVKFPLARCCDETIQAGSIALYFVESDQLD